MQKYQGKIEQTVVHPFIINTFVIPDKISHKRMILWEFLIKERSLKMYLVLNWKYSYHIVQSDQSKLSFTVHLFCIDTGNEADRKIERGKTSMSKVFFCRYLFKHVGKGYFCHKLSWDLEKHLYLYFLFNAKTLFCDISSRYSFISCCRTNSIAF